MFDIRQLRYFLAIIEEGSFSAAAQRVSVAQPALSLHVRNMEQSMSVKLLVRGPKGVVPTEEGELLARRARAILADIEQTEDEVRNFGKEPGGTVRLGFPGTIGEILSVPLIMRCRDRFPGVKIIIAEAMSGFVLDWLLARDIDLAVIYLDFQDSSVRSEALLEEELVLLAPADAEMDDGGIALENLSGKSLILPSKAHGLRIMLDDIFGARGMSVEPTIELDSYRNIKRLVEAGYGYSILPLHAVVEEQRAGRLSVRRFSNIALKRNAYIVQSVSRPTTRATEAIAGELKSVVGRLIEDGLWPGAHYPAVRAAAR
ncbi:hypothetical protein LL06_17365 [Hoeflea sp. BAL378]|uniref:LysR family transcriptional regulator n=1 Tax=Hoeflea sp. BAL378 TaxID=1547437 RepID=UPI000512EF3D|nr:LysR family transcriptional regulator [Hoeflea sp. BAL378]KGF68298.1 hypothetical protein LL06_17365 [Hoeflea sp. BAL378]